jgi:putative tricarboxylic transport membrane protein
MDFKSVQPFLFILNMTHKMDQFIDRTGLALEHKKFKFYPSLSGSALFMALSLFILIVMPSQIKIRPEEVINARTFPTILAFIMMGGAILNLLKDLYRLKSKKKLVSSELCLFTEIKALILLCFLIIYAVLIPLIGFIASSVIYGMLMLIFFRIKNWKYYLLVTLLAVIIGLLFKNVLHVRLP